ncbi:MAG: universal stress protein, partial [Gemmataceae bacterium]
FAQAVLVRRFHGVEKRAGSARVECVWRDGSPGEEIVALAREEEVDLIVMGTHGRGGLSRMLMGSVASDVLAEAPCGVLTYRDSQGK